MTDKTELANSLTKLSLNPSPSKSASAFASKQRQKPVADSWEDSSSDTETETDRPLSPQQSTDYPSAPPPTPISPKARETFINPYGYGANLDGASERERAADRERRPEKTDAVAKRLIAGALGVRAPKKTEDQKQYDKAIREKEIKRRDAEKAAERRTKEEAERAKAAVWED